MISDTTSKLNTSPVMLAATNYHLNHLQHVTPLAATLAAKIPKLYQVL